MPASSTNIDAKERLRLLEQQNQKLLREVALLRQQVAPKYRRLETTLAAVGMQTTPCNAVGPAAVSASVQPHAYQLIVRMDCPAHVDATFNEVYNEHVENLRPVPGVLAIRRYKTVGFDFAIGGNIDHIDPVKDSGEPVYICAYDLTGPDVITSAAWQAACEKGRWATEIRPVVLVRMPADTLAAAWGIIPMKNTLIRLWTCRIGHQLLVGRLYGNKWNANGVGQIKMFWSRAFYSAITNESKQHVIAG